MEYCKFCQMEILSYYLHVNKNSEHAANLKRLYDQIIKNQYIKLIK